jgi:hypothetical protein
MFLFSSFNQDLTQKIMSTLGLFNDFINNLKHKMKSYSTFTNRRWCSLIPKALGCPIRFWVQTWANHVYEICM